MSTKSSTSARTALAESSKTGEFKRTASVWRNWIGSSPDPEAKVYPAVPGRYHLYVAYACPWAHRTLMVRALKGLEDCISVTVVHPVWQKTNPEVDDHAGWVFGKDDDSTMVNTQGNGGPFPAKFPGNTPDTLNGCANIRQVYELAGDTNGKYSVPILWDKESKTIVNNESSEIIRMLNAEFNEFAKNPSLDLYPTDLRKEIDGLNEWIYPTINNGVYRCGFAKSQSAYDTAIAELTEAIQRCTGILENQRFLTGDQLTEADIRLFATLLRFDEVYTVYFKTNTLDITHNPVLLRYCREIYQQPGIAETVNMEQIKYHYYCSHPVLNHYSIVPKGSGFIEKLEQMQ